ncbi:MAG: hypothetical protein N2749_07380 [Clostridia bacterium]|nr:hypothetical protein [Clostridia bacterium]
MKEFWDYILKNKYIIICVCVVVLLYALGILEFLSKIIILILLIAFAVYIGKKLQDNEKPFKNIFDIKFTKKDEDVYYYQEKDEDKK